MAANAKLEATKDDSELNKERVRAAAIVSVSSKVSLMSRTRDLETETDRQTGRQRKSLAMNAAKTLARDR